MEIYFSVEVDVLCASQPVSSLMGLMIFGVPKKGYSLVESLLPAIYLKKKFFSAGKSPSCLDTNSSIATSKFPW